MKFRSWNKELKTFYYFKDGTYYTDKECNYFLIMDGYNINTYHWKNAEQELADGVFENDLMEFYTSDIDGNLSLHNGTVAIEDYKAVIQCDDGTFELWEALLDEEYYTVLGNIHEVKDGIQ